MTSLGDSYDDFKALILDIYAASVNGENSALSALYCSAMFPPEKLIAAVIAGKKLGFSNMQTAAMLINLEGTLHYKNTGALKMLFSKEKRADGMRFLKMGEKTDEHFKKLSERQKSQFVDEMVSNLSKRT